MTRFSFFFCSLHAEPHSSKIIKRHHPKLTCWPFSAVRTSFHLCPYTAEMLTDLRPDVFLKVTSSQSSWPALLFRWQTTMRQRLNSEGGDSICASMMSLALWRGDSRSKKKSHWWAETGKCDVRGWKALLSFSHREVSAAGRHLARKPLKTPLTRWWHMLTCGSGSYKAIIGWNYWGY